MNWLRFLLIMTIAYVAATASAEAGVVVTPDRHIVVLAPGETQTVEYQVYNSGPQDLDIELDIKDWSGLQATGRIDMSSLISVKQNNFNIKANESKPLVATVKAPPNVDGEILTMIFLCYKENEGSSLNIRNGIPLYLVIKGTEKYSVRIQGIKTEYIEQPEGNALKLMVNVTNNGNIHIIPDVMVSIKTDKGEVLKGFELNAARTILRQEYYTYRFTWPSPMLAEGDYVITASLSYGDKIKGMEATARFSVKDGKLRMAQEKPEK